MRYNDEFAIMKALEIESWRNLSKDKFIRFLAMMPEMDRGVALEVIGQFPEFTKLARAAMDDADRAYSATLTANARSLEAAHQIHLEALAIFNRELDKDLGPEERMRVLDDIRDIHEKARAKDTENKRFLAEQLTKKVVATVGVVVLALVFVGAKVGVQGGSGRGGSTFS